MRTCNSVAKLVIGLLFAAAASCAPREEIYTSKGFMYFDAGGDVFVAEGKWQRAGGSRTVLVPDVNSVRIECYRQQGFCDEYIAKLITPEDDETKTTRGKSLFLMKQTFKITEWNPNYLSASADPRAADLFLRISFRDGVAERSARWTSARGAEVDDPSVVHNWVLRVVKPPDPPN